MSDYTSTYTPGFGSSPPIPTSTHCWYVYGPGNSNWWTATNTTPPGGGGGGTGPVATVIPVSGTGTVRTEESCASPMSVIRQIARDGAEAALGRAPVDGDRIRVISDADDSNSGSRTFTIAGTQYVATEGSCGVSGGGGGGGGGGYIP